MTRSPAITRSATTVCVWRNSVSTFRFSLPGAWIEQARACLVRCCSLTAGLAVLCGQTQGAAADANLLRLGKHQVHPTRILAKYSDRVLMQSSPPVLQSAGLVVARRYPLVEGLVVLDAAESQRAGVGKLRASNKPIDAAQALMAKIQTLEDSGLFEYVQPNYIYTNLLAPTDARFSDNTLWGLRNTGAGGGLSGADIGALEAWDLTTGSTNVIVAVIDTGIRYTHQELANQMWRNPGEIPGNRIDDDGDGYVDNVFGVNPADGNGNPLDDNDHGTHVAGTIGAAANDGHPHVGVAWDVRLMACKFLGVDGFGTTEDAIRCVDFAVQNGARVINASWGGGPFERALLDSLTAARRRGVLFIAACGNDFSDNDVSAFYPASYALDNIISVAAIDRRDRLSSFSNFGRRSVHIGAPGDSIFSCIAQSDSAYDTFDGTSMAAPHVAGVAALILARFPKASVPEVRERLLSTAVRISTLDGKATTSGRVNAYRALSATPDGILEIGFDPPEGSDLSARRPVQFAVTVTDLVGITNATVWARVQDAASDVAFRNDGTNGHEKAGDEVYTAELTLPTAAGPFNILFNVSAPGKPTVERLASYNIAAPPLNDHFADALDIPADGAVLQWTNRFATVEPGEPKHARSPSASASVWWNWIPAAHGQVIIDTAGSSFDTVLAVYTNNTLTLLKEVAWADDAPGRKQGRATFSAQAGVAYHIAVAGYSAIDFGTVRLRVEPGGEPDASPPQVAITGPASGLTITNATDSKVLVTGTAMDPTPNSSGLRQVQVQVNRNLASTAIGTTNWSSTVFLREGQNRIKVSASDFAGNSSPIRSVTVFYEPLISPNDFLTNAIELTATSGVISGNSTRATKEPGEPVHAGNSGGKSIWWLFRPSADGVLSLSTANSTFNTLLALYGGRTASVLDLEVLSSNDDAASGSEFSSLEQALKGGRTYYIAVDGFNASSGVVQLDYAFHPTPVWHIAVHSSAGGSVHPGSGLYEAGVTVVFTATPDPFFNFDHWEGGVSSHENPVSFVVRADAELRPFFSPVAFSDSFESGDFTELPWTTAGNTPWIVQTDLAQAGKFAARSGPIDNGQKTALILADEFRGGAGSFGVRVSSELAWDTLEFFINGRRLNRWSGEVPWTLYQFDVASGANTLEWRYSKDFFNTKAGLDAAFIDNIDLPLLVPADNTSPAHLGIQRLGSGAFELTISGQPNQIYVIQACSELNGWKSVSTNVARSGVIHWMGSPEPEAPVSFFRAVVP